jgi:hypothetical protein
MCKQAIAGQNAGEGQTATLGCPMSVLPMVLLQNSTSNRAIFNLKNDQATQAIDCYT